MELVRVFVATFQRGGWLIVGAIFFVSVVAWYIGLGRLLYLRSIARARRRFLASLDSMIDGASQAVATGIEAYDMLAAQLVRRCARNEECPSIKLIFREFLITIIPETDAGLPAMSAWISVAPLLGLLGTVMGMIQTFQVITAFGVGNPGLTAQGISVALITTQAGLTVAFPAMLFHNYLVSRKSALVALFLKDGEDLVNRINTRNCLKASTRAQGANQNV